MLARNLLFGLSLAVVAIAGSGCGGSSCGAGDVDCYFDHASFFDNSGNPISWTVFPATSLPSPAPSPTPASGATGTPVASGQVTENSPVTVGCTGGADITAITTNTYAVNGCGTRACAALTACVGKTSCAFSPSNTSCGGDPCVGSVKEFTFAVACGPAPSASPTATPGLPPEFTTTAQPVTYASVGDLELTTLDWSDPSGCTPAVCVKFCANGVCSSHTGCFGGNRDGITSGSISYGVSYSVAPDSQDDTFDMVLTPVSSPTLDCSNLSALLAPGSDAQAGADATVTQTLKAKNPPSTGGGSSACSTATLFANNCGNSDWGNHAGASSPSNPDVSCSTQVAAGAVCAANMGSDPTWSACPSGLTCVIACNSSGYPTQGTCQ
jgi:hypothetical protein